MAGLFEIVENHKDEIEGELPHAIERALEAIGLQVEGYAKKNCPVDTGLLRNSITYAISGKPAAIKSYHAGDSSGAMIKGGKKVKTKEAGKSGASMSVGFYTGVAPSDAEPAVYIGTNVEYAPYVEFGHKLPGGGVRAGEHFLERAVLGHTNQLKKLAEQALKGF